MWTLIAIKLGSQQHKNLNRLYFSLSCRNHCFCIALKTNEYTNIRIDSPIYYFCKRIELLSKSIWKRQNAKKKAGKLHNASQYISIVHCKQAERKKIFVWKNEHSTQSECVAVWNEDEKPFALLIMPEWCGVLSLWRQ